ncbi:MAG: acyl-CoA dehydrogenase [Rhodospirillales bacterium]
MTNPFIAARRALISRPVMRAIAKALPPMSDTEREAIEAGTVWFDRELFSGNPNWAVLRDHPPAKLTDEEQAFIDGPVEQLCRMVDDWTINHTLHDLPPEAWAFLKERGFFGMIIPKRYGGLGFSAFAHSSVIMKLSTRSLVAAVTAMVPNSLGPAELLLEYGTDAQRDYYLPRLAKGDEVPCFALTSPRAGSDAASMVDRGVVCRGTWQGKETLGMRVTWSKRYITLAPIATVLGLAFKLYDPDGLLGDKKDLGITVALVPTKTPGVKIGRRHWPAMQSFQNGPNHGDDVFMPLDWIIGGPKMVGEGWKMLMTALAAGRSISLPSLSTGGTKFAARVSGAYARIREQFGVPVGRFEGVQEPLARIAATAYLLEAARRVTCSAIDGGEKPAVIGAIMKYHATERLRLAINDAMDVHGGKGICDGPSNYLSQTYYSLPVSITVEGANILTRSLIIFGQGAIRNHPWLLKEMTAAADPDHAQGLRDFDRAFFGHLGHHVATWWRAFHRNLLGGATASAPGAKELAPYYRAVGRASASFALVTEIALLVLQGALKRKEALSARLGDVLSGMYLVSCALKRWEQEGQQAADLPLLRYAVERELIAVEQRLDEILRNFPGGVWRFVLRRVIFPWGRWRKPASDLLVRQAAEFLMQPGEARDRLTGGIFLARDFKAPISELDRALEMAIATESAEKKMREAKIHDPDRALAEKLIGVEEHQAIEEKRRLVTRLIQVDDFAPEELTGIHKDITDSDKPTLPRAVAGE